MVIQQKLSAVITVNALAAAQRVSLTHFGYYDQSPKRFSNYAGYIVLRTLAQTQVHSIFPHSGRPFRHDWKVTFFSFVFLGQSPYLVGLNRSLFVWPLMRLPAGSLQPAELIPEA
ncbi:jg9611 [Pararge aegeria aegeria]|uniref:Jg9611 protein n=1 Tax=Pararge aegeria aegeria TaxID=348720 RepID=A0A8S4RUP0_9NEOP|nr:jg9611 [Pararge aegeria aegeria]